MILSAIGGVHLENLNIMVVRKGENDQPIVLAISKGRILEEALDLLGKISIKIIDHSKNSRKLALNTNREDIRLLVVRAVDVPTYVEYGAADMGITGKDVLMEHDSQDYYEILDLGISKCRLMVATAVGSKHSNLRPKVATKYPKTATAFFESKGLQAEIIRLSGSMELAPSFGLADQIVDLVDTGDTLRANGLEPTELICEISSYLIVNKASMKVNYARVKEIIDSFEDVMGAGCGKVH